MKREVDCVCVGNAVTTLIAFFFSEVHMSLCMSMIQFLCVNEFYAIYVTYHLQCKVAEELHL